MAIGIGGQKVTGLLSLHPAPRNVHKGEGGARKRPQRPL